jgi:hypothetical protein
MPDDLRQLYLVLGGGFPTPMGERQRSIKHFYRRQYQITGWGWRTIYYAFFMDWKGKRRKIPLGSEIKAAKEGPAPVFLSMWDMRINTRTIPRTIHKWCRVAKVSAGQSPCVLP